MTKEPHPDWTETERWAWERIQAGEIADFNEKLGATADPAMPEDWDERRTLRPAFWETIIEPCWREHLHRKGIRIVGALLTDEKGVSLDWQRAELPAEIWLDRAVVKGKVQFGCAKVPSVLSFAGSRFKAAVDMQGLEVGESLLLNNKAHFSAAVILRGAKVGGQLTASGSHFGAKLDMHGIKVGQNLFLHHEAYFAGALDLVGANIGGQLAASSSHFMAALDMQGLEVGQDLFLHEGAHFAGDVILNGAKIDGQLAASGSRFEAALDMQGLKVEQDLFLHDKAHFGGKVDLVHARIGGGALVSGSIWHGLIDMTGARVDGELHLASSKSPVPIWGEAAGLVLRNVHLGALQDSHRDGKDAWPVKLDLHGCLIDRLGGTRGDDDGSDMLGRTAGYWVRWLARGTKDQFSRQPYHMIAGLLREAGYGGKASTVLYAARVRERDEFSSPFQKIWLWFMWCFIGFGIGRFFAIAAGAWFLTLSTIGTAVLDFPTKAPLPNDNPLWKIAASMDRLIPFAELVPRLSITLNETLHTWQILYFAAHSLLGWVLAAMVVAGLAGLTQRP